MTDRHFMDEPGNLSDSRNPHIQDVIARRFSRRSLLTSLVAAGAVAGLGAAFPLRDALAQGGSTLAFKSLALKIDETHHVPEGYKADLVIGWGDPVAKGAKPLDLANQTAASQAGQFGYNCDFIAFMPLPMGSANSEHGLLFVNHEYTNGEMMHPGVKSASENRAKADKAWTEVEMAAHGGAVVEVKKEGGAWKYVADSRFNRRITGTTEMAISGPAAGTDRLKTSVDPSGKRILGMLNNCGGGTTPWGTVLTCEENFNGYFGGDAAKTGKEAANHKRYGIPAMERSWYGWARNHDRFNIEKEPNEPNRFGWIVEIDPYDPGFQPVKRTALGRFKHEAATTVVNKDGRVVVYTGDDEAGDYVYKFVTRGIYNAQNRAANFGLLDEGTLYAAKFTDEGAVEWIALEHGQGKLTAENGFASQADVLIEARRAADVVGATRMDRPEDVEFNPVNGRVHVMLTNNSGRGEKVPLDNANPRAKNSYGHIIEIIPPGSEKGEPDHAALKATWEMFVLAGNPAEAAHGAMYHKDQAETGVWFAAPDNVAFDPQGRIYVLTDQGSAQKRNKIPDGVFVADSEGPAKGLFKLLFACPIDAEMCGGAFTPDGKTLFLSVQHPGEGTNFDSPNTRWPDFKAGQPPRPAVVAVHRPDGKEIGA
ncbi:MAG: PhoX family phosphatase [Candidatus Odyssella sp.]|nr:PhoX family phosphatase [Candidatus Odyssella sp.]